MPWGIIEGVYSASYTNAGIIVEDENSSLPWQQVGDHIITTQATFWWGGWKFKPHISYQLNHRKEFEDYDTEFAELDMELRTSRFDFKVSNSFENWDLIIGSQGMNQENINVGAEWLIPNTVINDIALLSLLNWNKNNLQVQFGARYDYREIAPFFTPDFILAASFQEFYNPSFSIGGTYQINENMVFRTNFAQGYRAPSLFELFANGVHNGAQRYEEGNPDLKSENNREWDISFQTHGEHVVLDFALYDNHINNFIYSIPTGEMEGNYSVYKHTQNKARLYGGEFGLDFHPHIWHDLHLKSTVSLVYGENLNLNEPLPLMPPLTWRNEARVEWGNWNSFEDIYLKLETSYYAKQSRISSEETLSDSYLLVNLGFGTSLGKFNFGLFAHNLLNKEYITHLSLLKDQGINNPGRNISLKISCNF
jgi:iron complex outermembrane receptor protein